MAAGRPSNVNLGLLAVTILSLLIAAYALLLAPKPDSRLNAPRNGDQLAAENACVRGGVVDGGTGSKQNRSADAEGHSGSASSSKTEVPEKSSSSTTTNKTSSDSTTSSNELAATDSSGNISGVVLDAAGKPVESAHVVARPSDLRDQPTQQPDFERELAEYERHIQRLRAQQRSADTESDGRFTLKGLNAALAYDLSATAVSGGVGRVSRVACGDDVTILLSRECILRGKVSRGDGKPLSRFRVNWLRADMPSEPDSETVLSVDGRYEARVRPGRHTVWVSLDGVEDSARQEIDIPEAGAEANFSFSGLATLAGTVKDTHENPLPDVMVRLMPTYAESKEKSEESMAPGEGAQRPASVRTDSLGRYRFEALSPGSYLAKVSLSERSDTREITLGVGENTQDFALNAGARVTLRFRNPSGEPVTDVNVQFERKGRTARAAALPAEEPGVRVYIGLEPGDYTIRYFARGGAWSRQDAKISDGDNVINLDIAQAAFLQGKVSGAGAPDNLMLRLRPESGKADNSQHYSAMVSADGSYRLGPVLPGDFVVELLAQRRSVVLTQNVKLGAGDNTQDLAVRDLAGLVLRVTQPDGKPAAGARVTMQSGKNSYAARCDERGLAKLSYVPTGECTLVAEAGTFKSAVYTPLLRSGESEFTLELKAPNCVRVSKVDRGGEAERAGVMVNDLIILYHGRDVTDRKTLDALIKESKGTESVTFSLVRNGQIVVLNIKGGVFGGSYQDAVR
jgi:protocatechuate 3,4-dioxygenase beta subunit